jgi:hypothetical protein
VFGWVGQAVRSFFTPQGLVGALLGGGLWVIASGMLAQFADFRIGPAVAVGSGAGLLGIAGFLWWVVIPGRELAAARRPQLKALLRRYYNTGHRLLILASPATSEEDIDAKLRWKDNLEAVLSEALGKHQMRVVMRGTLLDPNQLLRLNSLIDRLENIELRDVDLNLLPEPPRWREGGRDLSPVQPAPGAFGA